MLRSISKRALSIWFPRLPLDRAARDGVPGATGLFALTAEQKSAVRLACLSDEAMEAGLEPGMTLSDARAIASRLITCPQDPLREERLLLAVQRFCSRYSPSSSLGGEAALHIDITGCAHLFGGEEQLACRVSEELEGLGVETRLAIADTKAAAVALAEFQTSTEEPIFLSRPGQLREDVSSVPITSIADPGTSELMDRLGFRTIGCVLPLKSSDLARRCGLGFVEALNAMLGRRPDPIVPERPLPSFSARMSFPDPIGLQDDVSEAFRRLTERVCERLSEAAYGARGFALELHRAEKSKETVHLGLAWPSRDPRLIARQFGVKLDRLDAGFGIDLMRLSALMTEPHMPSQHGLGSAPQEEGSLESLLATLGNRLGFHRVETFAHVSSHLPERSFCRVPPSSASAVKPSRDPGPRPYRLFPLERAECLIPGRPPRSFRWRGRSFEAIAVEGPERILPEWWVRDSRRRGGPRDYWRVQTKEGERLWMVTFPAETDPSWYVTGVFA